MQKDSTTLYSYFETGDTPTQEQFQNFIDSSANLVDENWLTGSVSGLNGVTPPDQTTAQHLPNLVNYTSTAEVGGTGFLLQPALRGRQQMLINTTPHPNYIYPRSGEQIRALGADMPLFIPAKSAVLFLCYDDGAWEFVTYGIQAPAVQAIQLKINLSQIGTATPTAVDLVNQAGAYTLARSAVGVYSLSLTDIVTDPEQVSIVVSQNNSAGLIFASQFDATTVAILTKNLAGVLTDVILANSTLDIQIYKTV